MDFKNAVKAWGKSLGLFVAGFVASAYVLVFVAGLIIGLRNGTGVNVNWFYMTLASLVLAVPSFLIFWGCFRFRSKLPLESLNWYELGVSGLVVLPLLTIVSLPLIMLGIRNVAPTLFEALLPPFVLLAVAEAASWVARIRARKAAEKVEAAYDGNTLRMSNFERAEKINDAGR